jgi:NADH dehydrogenase [ubiquinone] 1 alpha subcomplex assembly factor 7
MPLEQRLARLLKNASNDERRKVIDDGVHRLVDPINMGAQYKFLGVVGRTTGAEETKVDGVFPFGVELKENA